MKREVSVEANKAQFMIEKAMDDITRATHKVLMDYDTRRQVENYSNSSTSRKLIFFLSLRF